MGVLRRQGYFFRLFAGAVSILLLFAVILVTGIYVSMRQYVAATENKKNELILSQVKYSLAQLNEAMRDFCISTYYGSDAQVLMYQQGIDDYDTMLRLNRIKEFSRQENDYIHSVYIVNSRKNVFYSTFQSYIVEDEVCNHIMRSQTPLPVLRPVLRHLTNPVTNSTQPVLSYFLYELTDRNQIMQNGIVLNVNLDKFLDSLQHLNQSIHSNDKIYIYSMQDLQFLTTEPQTAYTPEMVAIQGFLAGYDEKDLAVTSTAVPLNTDNGDYTLTYEYWPETGWVLLQLQAVMTLDEYFRQISTSLFTITVVTLLIAVCAYYIISRRLYSPVQDIVRMLPKNTYKKENDEFSVIRQAFERYQLDNAALVKEHRQYIDSSKYFFLRQIILNSFSFNESKLAKICGEHSVAVDLTRPMRLCLMKILHYRELLQSNMLDDVTLLKYAIQNVSKEIMDLYVRNEYIEMEHDSILFLLEDEKDVADKLDEAARKIQKACFENLNVSLTFSFCGAIDDARLLWNEYNLLREQAKYYLLLGSSMPVTAQRVEALALSDDMHDVLLLEDDLLANLCLDAGILQIKLQELFNHMRGLKYDYILYAVMRLQRKLTPLLEAAAEEQKEFDWSLLLEYENFDSNTLEQIQNRIWTILQFAQTAGILRAEEPDDIAAQAKRLIDAQYADANLNAAYIADSIGVSPSTLSRAFKKGMHMAVPEYLNLVRLNHAAKRMRQSQASILELMYQVGFENESNFYRLFKKTYHMTPREYLRAHLNNPE